MIPVLFIRQEFLCPPRPVLFWLHPSLAVGYPEAPSWAPLFFHYMCFPCGIFWKGTRFLFSVLQMISRPICSYRQTATILFRLCSTVLNTVRANMDWDKGPRPEQKQKQKLFYLDKTLFYMSMILPLALCCHHVSRNPGGIFDCVFKFDKQISSVVIMSFYQLRWRPTSLSVIFRALSMISLAHVVILCMLDLISRHFAPCRLPKMQQPNRKKSCDHITPVLASWHWLLFFFLGSSSEFYLFLRVSVARCHLFFVRALTASHSSQSTEVNRPIALGDS